MLYQLKCRKCHKQDAEVAQLPENRLSMLYQLKCRKCHKQDAEVAQLIEH